MTERASAGKELAKGAGVLLGHVVALVVGVILMFVGIALGVTLVALPVGFAVGFAGLAIALWGLFGWAQEKKTTTPPNMP
jgi:hypothetical protein